MPPFATRVSLEDCAMMHVRLVRAALFSCLVLGAMASVAWAEPPNWKAHAIGTTRPEGGVHVDDFSGISSHLGRFEAGGFHVLNVEDFTFVGQATWTAANGDEL